MFFFKKKSRCVSCRKRIPDYASLVVERNDPQGLHDAVALGRFVCECCHCSFHGTCGRAGEVNPKGAKVTCPSCNQRQKLPLPFKLGEPRKGKKTKSTEDFIREKTENDDVY